MGKTAFWLPGKKETSNGYQKQSEYHASLVAYFLYNAPCSKGQYKISKEEGSVDQLGLEVGKLKHCLELVSQGNVESGNETEQEKDHSHECHPCRLRIFLFCHDYSFRLNKISEIQANVKLHLKIDFPNSITNFYSQRPKRNNLLNGYIC